MCAKIRSIQSEVQRKFAGRQEKLIKEMESRAIRREFTHFKRSSNITNFLEMDGVLQAGRGEEWFGQ